MSELVGLDVHQLHTVTLFSYEFVVSADDFYVALNGPCAPSMCDSYRIDGNGCFVLQEGLREFVSEPIPEHLRALFVEAPEILFVKFAQGVVADAKVVPLVVETMH